MARQSLSVVAPVYNEVEGIERFHAELNGVLAELPYESTVILVNDGSTDGTTEVLDRLYDAHPATLTVVHLSRNFGHQAALTAGMDLAGGDAMICMDADLQHPPSVIPALVERWRQGFDVVHTVRRQTVGGGPMKDLTASLFYALLDRLSSTPIQSNAADFRLISRRVAEVFRRDLRERDRFVRGLVTWVGFPSCCVEFDAAARTAGNTKYTLRRMLSFARTGLVSFSKVPLKVASVIGLVVTSVSALYALFAVASYLFFRTAVMPGWASTIVVVTFLGGCQLLFLGLLGEYIGTIFDETKARPIYVVAEVREAKPLRGGAPAP
jgi:glycosyltransferase involved in cell wall biosynthesis